MRRLVALCLAMLALVDTASSRDRVVLQLPDKASRLVLAGDVADYTAEIIEIHLTTGKPVRQYAAAHVLAVQTIQTESHRKGLTLIEHGELDLAQAEFETALTAEPRRWVQREILGWLVKIAMRQGDHVTAGQRFLQIAATEPAPREYALIPLVWGTAQVDSRVRQQARLWITGDSDLQRLLGSSLLLADAQYADLCQSELIAWLRSVPSSASTIPYRCWAGLGDA